MATANMNVASISAITVLLVDDDDYQRKVQLRMMQALGVREVHEVDSAEQALAQATHLGTGLHLILCDLDMPGMDGMELLRRLAEQRCQAAILVVSGKHEAILRSVRLMAEENGLHLLGTAAKPLALPQLRQHLGSYLQSPRATRSSSTDKVTGPQILHGLERGEFIPYFQPKVELSSLRVCGFEALARWQHPQLGNVLPGDFIEVAQCHCLIDLLSWAMLEKSATQLRLWLDSGLELSISVNFSQSSLAHPQFAQQVLDILARVGVPPQNFIVEITETVAMTDVGQSLENLARLRMRGLGLSIDDFGTGHSSMQQLSMVPYTELKIDQMFVTGAADRPHLNAVVESSVGIAKKLRLTSVAEGVETRADWACMQALGCDIAQGYYIAAPMPGHEVQSWISAWAQRKP